MPTFSWSFIYKLMIFLARIQKHKQVDLQTLKRKQLNPRHMHNFLKCLVSLIIFDFLSNLYAVLDYNKQCI